MGLFAYRVQMSAVVSIRLLGPDEPWIFLSCYYHFQLVCFLPDIMTIVGQTDTKIISDTNLAFLVRQMAIHANVGYESYYCDVCNALSN